MKRPSDLTVADLKVLGPAAVGYAAKQDFAYDAAKFQKAVKSKPSSNMTPDKQLDKLKV